jgi:hypothetical protein
MSVIIEAQGRDENFHDGEDKNADLSLRYSHDLAFLHRQSRNNIFVTIEQELQWFPVEPSPAPNPEVRAGQFCRNHPHWTA